jgi:hypothetical protein
MLALGKALGEMAGQEEEMAGADAGTAGTAYVSIRQHTSAY